MRVELFYRQYNISDSQALFSCSVLIILEIASLDTLLLCSGDIKPGFALSLLLIFLPKPRLLFLQNCCNKKKCVNVTNLELYF